jgi:3-hydroxybutyrate dehydrogenase
MLDINLIHPIRVTQLAIRHFLEQKKRGSIVHISSIAGQDASLPTPMYIASKWGISGFVRSLAPLERGLGIRVTAVAPGVVKTPLWVESP